MKKIFKMQEVRLLIVGFLMVMTEINVNAQTLETINSCIVPPLTVNQHIKGLYRIYSNIDGMSMGYQFVMTKADNSNLVRFQPKNDINTRQLWYLIQDYSNNTFEWVNGADSSWLWFDASSGVAKTDASPTKTIVNGIPVLDSKYQFEFIKPLGSSNYCGTSGKIMAMRPAFIDNKLLQYTYNNSNPYDYNFLCSDTATARLEGNKIIWNAGTALPATFVFEQVGSNYATGVFTPVPFQMSPYHNNTNVYVAGVGKITQIGRNTIGSEIPENNITLSSRAMVFANSNDSLLYIDLSQATQSVVGFLSYEKTDYSLSAVRNTNIKTLKPRLGLGVNNAKLYIIREGLTDTITYTDTFSAQYPVVVSYRDGAISLVQNRGNTIYRRTFPDVAISSVLSTGIQSKSEILAIISNNDVIRVGYKAGNILFNSNDTGNITPIFATTNPDFPYMPALKGTVKNGFDWRTKYYNLRYLSNGVPTNQQVYSPFFSNNTLFASIAARYSTGSQPQHIGGEDNDPYSGWELIKVDFGYNNDGSPKLSQELRSEPYMILYNRLSGTLRVFVYINNNSIANNYRVSLSVINAPKYDQTQKYKPPFLWSSFINGYTFDDDDITSLPYSKSRKLNSSGSGQFYYVDFDMVYDPCIAFFESAIQVSVDKVTTGTMQIVGRSLGGSIPGSQAISDWMNQNQNFMMGALTTNPSTLAQSIGSFTLNNSQNWGLNSMANYAQFTIPGTKVPEWQKQAAYLDMISADTRASGQFVSASGTIIKATGELASISTVINPVGAALKASGTYIEGAGKFMEATGTSIAAQAARLRYENLQDQPDKLINMKLPDPQPSLVFSELGLQGTLNISTPMFDDIYITTPGSLNANQAPENRLNGTKASFPLYNEPLGLFSVLNKPNVQVSVVRSSISNGYNIAIGLKEYPVVALNTQPGLSSLIPYAKIAVTTYRNNIAGKSRSTKAYVLSNSLDGLSADMQLPAQIDISSLVDLDSIEANYRDVSGDALTESQLATKLNEWVKVQIVIGLTGFGGKLPNGIYAGFNQYVACRTTNSYLFSKSNSATVDGVALSKLSTNFMLSNNTYFGNRHVLNRLDDNFNTLMNTYCNSHQTNTISSSQVSYKTTNTGVGTTENSQAVGNHSITVYPNPASSSFTVSYYTKSQGKVNISIRDFTGRILLEHYDEAHEKNVQTNAQINCSALLPGVYTVMIIFSDGSSEVAKIVKN